MIIVTFRFVTMGRVRRHMDLMHPDGKAEPDDNLNPDGTPKSAATKRRRARQVIPPPVPMVPIEVTPTSSSNATTLVESTEIIDGDQIAAIVPNEDGTIQIPEGAQIIQVPQQHDLAEVVQYLPSHLIQGSGGQGQETVIIPLYQ